MREQTPSVFISYAEDPGEPEHARKALALGQWLEARGVAVHLHHFEPSPQEGFHRWMLGAFESSDYVLVLVTDAWVRRAAGREAPAVGRGAAFEGKLVLDQILADQGRADRILPVLVDNQPESIMPFWMASYRYYRLPEGFWELYWHITGQRTGARPTRGSLVKRPATEPSMLPGWENPPRNALSSGGNATGTAPDVATRRSELGPPTENDAEWTVSEECRILYRNHRDAILTRFYGIEPATQARPGKWPYPRPWSPRTATVLVHPGQWALSDEVKLGGRPHTDGWSCGDEAHPLPPTLATLAEDTERWFKPMLDSLVRRGKLQAWPHPQCRLMGVSAGNPPAMHFAQTTYDKWRFSGSGVLADELRLGLQAATRAGLSGEALQDAVAANLPWRRRHLPDLAAFRAFDSRICIGGVQVVTVLQSGGLLHMLFSERPPDVGDNPSMTQALPRGFHQPLEGENPPSWHTCYCLVETLAKEFFEELLGGDPRVRGPTQADSVRSALADVQTLMARHGRAWVTGLSYGLDNGNYELCLLLLLDDKFEAAADRFYRKHRIKRRGTGQFIENWESLEVKRTTLEPVNLRQLFDGRDWVPGSAMAIGEALRVLREQGLLR